MVKEHQHWTNRGTFRLEPLVLGGSWHWNLWFKDKKLGTYSFIQTAAESISKGEHDAEIGCSGADLNVPHDYEKWNGFR